MPRSPPPAVTAATIPRVASHYDRIGSWLDAEPRRTAGNVLVSLSESSRSANEWAAIGDAVAALETALGSGDAKAVVSATARLELMTDHRVDRVDPKKEQQAPPPLVDRMVHLQRRLDVDLTRLTTADEADQRSDRTK
ncbi:CATRA system-associated protein [Actinosynnema sp. NPDC050801]|uniref:CATRA system-associated protein n=1 Tax=unclassified Actinosynnema TaxID=2637065 RepID=UPI0033E1F942